MPKRPARNTLLPPTQVACCISMGFFAGGIHACERFIWPAFWREPKPAATRQRPFHRRGERNDHARAANFCSAAATKSADLKHRQTIRQAIDHYDASAQSAARRFLNWEAARQKCHEIKWEAMNHLDQYLLEFEAHVKARGGHVFWAETAEDARRYIADLATARGVRTIVKSKSMVTEEIHLTPALEKQGIRVFETDLGEFIVQLRERTALPHRDARHASDARGHREAVSRKDWARSSSDDPAKDDPAIGRRRAPRLAPARFSPLKWESPARIFWWPIRGMIASPRTKATAGSERALPRIHVAVAGIEKVIPRLEDLALLWPVLATAGTASRSPCYNTLIGGPRAPDEIDGPEEFHVVLLDNGRSDLLADAEQRDVLHCIRCGACLNACPVYRTIGGHTYGTTVFRPDRQRAHCRIFGG